MSNIDYYGLLNLLKRPKFLLVICVEIFVVIIVIGGYRIFFHVPDEKQAVLEAEFKEIIPLEDAHLVSYHASNKLLNALVSAHYLTDLDSLEIFKYYDEELTRHGWHLVEIKKVKIWDEDLGGKSAIYCKGEYYADLYYAGQDAPDKLTYALDMSWRMHDCKQLRDGQNNNSTSASP
jgi:hypothetical protein